MGRRGFTDAESILLTGATGFVGGAVRARLEEAGWHVRCLSRHARRAAAEHPDLEWVEGDVENLDAAARALDGCSAAMYLVHGLGEGAGLVKREVAAAQTFAEAAALAGVERIVYLGGVAPAGAPSPHLASRLLVGEVLRAGTVPAIELRASMIIGHGSLSWLIVRDLAARLPLMVLPRWLRSRTQPVAIDDVVAALVGALDIPITGDGGGGLSFDLPGPEILSGREILELTARALGLPRPRVVDVPMLSPRLSSHWVRFVTRARWAVAREVVLGLSHDLLARDDRFWTLIDHPARASFREAASLALVDERGDRPARGVWARVERRLAGLRGHRSQPA